MQAIRILVRRATSNPKLMRRIYRPSVLQQTEDEALEVPSDWRKRQVELEDDILSTQAEIVELFEQMDSDGDGKLEMDEVSKALRAGKIPTSRTSLTQLTYLSGAHQQSNQSQEEQSMGLPEFVDLVRRRKETLHDAYYWMLRHKHKGKFSSSTLRIAAQKSGVHLSDLEIKQIQQRLGNTLKYSEFVDYLLLAPDVNPRYFLDSWYTEAFCDDAESQFSTPRDIQVNDDISFAHAAAKKLSCGGIAGALSRTLTAPLDRIRVVLMTNTEQLGMGRALSLVTRNGGYSQLWMGNGVNCLKIAPEVGIKLLSFDMFKNQLAQDPSNVTVQERFVAGGMAGVLSQITVYPFEVIKTRLSMSTSGEPIGMVDCFRNTISEGGYRAFYAGMAPSIVGIIPYAALDLTLNSWLKDQASAYLEGVHKETSVPVLLGCGMASSGTATIVTFPLNVIRTRAQASGESFGNILRWLHANGGWRAFYRGLIPCLAKVMPATSFSYAAYEALSSEWDRKLLPHPPTPNK